VITIIPDGVTVRLAQQSDVSGLLALESRYFVGNLDQSHRADGFISMLHSRDWFERTIDDGGLHVAVIEGTVAGFIAVTDPPPRTAPDLPPIVSAMLDLAETIEFNGAPIAEQRYALRGPVLISEQARGGGIYAAFNTVTAQAYRDRFDIGVLFVSAGNPRSLHTTTIKLGAEPLAVFEAGGGTYHFLAFRFHPDDGQGRRSLGE
jgi:hypothetical protein